MQKCEGGGQGGGGGQRKGEERWWGRRGAWSGAGGRGGGRKTAKAGGGRKKRVVPDLRTAGRRIPQNAWACGLGRYLHFSLQIARGPGVQSLGSALFF